MLGALPRGLQKPAGRKCNRNRTHILKWSLSSHQSKDMAWPFGKLIRPQGSISEASPAFSSSFLPTQRREHILPSSGQTLFFSANSTIDLKTLLSAKSEILALERGTVLLPPWGLASCLPGRWGRSQWRQASRNALALRTFSCLKEKWKTALKSLLRP